MHVTMSTHLVQGKVMFSRLKRTDHFDLIKEELVARKIDIKHDEGWTSCIALLKEDEKDQKFFIPKTASHQDYEICS